MLYKYKGNTKIYKNILSIISHSQLHSTFLIIRKYKKVKRKRKIDVIDVTSVSTESPNNAIEISNRSTKRSSTPLIQRMSVQEHTETEDLTPKSSIKSRRSRSFYNPVTEDITPVTPEKFVVSAGEDVFKTPINTPGLFESIRKSAIRSRKRGRESVGSVLKAKRPKMEYDSSMKGKSLVEVVPRKSPRNRLSNFTGVKELFRNKSPENDLRKLPSLRPIMSPKVPKSPENDYTKIAGVKKLFSTPKDNKSPKNALTDIAGVKKLFATPKVVKSPKNDLTAVPNLRKIMSPKVQKMPKNDLTQVPNLRRMMSPKAQKTPKNDLSQVPNLRKIMSPKNQNSPANDLTQPFGVKKMFATPKQSKQPLNDLSDVEGVTEIFNTSQVDRDIENVEDLFTKLSGKGTVRSYKFKSLSPKKTKADIRLRNSLGDVPAFSPRVEQWVEEQAKIVKDSSLTSEDIVFTNLPSRRVYGGKSLSPTKGSDKNRRRKTIGDNTENTPNIAVWKTEQNKKKGTETLEKKTARGAKKRRILSNEEIDEIVEKPKKILRTRRGVKKQNEESDLNNEAPKLSENEEVEIHTRTRTRAKTTKKKQIEEAKTSPCTTEDLSTKILRTRTKVKNVDIVIDNKPEKEKKGRRVKQVSENDSIEVSKIDEQIDKDTKLVTRRRNRVVKEIVTDSSLLTTTDSITETALPNVKQTSKGKTRSKQISDDQIVKTKVEAPKKQTRRGRKPIEALSEDIGTEETKNEEVKPVRRGRRQKIEEEVKKDEDSAKSETITTTRNRKAKIPEDLSEQEVVRKTRTKKLIEEPMKEEVELKITKRSRTKTVADVGEIDVNSPRATRTRRGVNRKYSQDEYDIPEKKGRQKKNVQFEEPEKMEPNDDGVRRSKRRK